LIPDALPLTPSQTDYYSSGVFHLFERGREFKRGLHPLSDILSLSGQP
jgi:hypothetical protein